MKKLLLILLPFFAFAQQAVQPVYTEFVNVAGPNGTVQCIEVPRSEEYMRTVIENAQSSGLHIIKETIGRRNMKGELMTGAQAAGLDIVLRGTDQLEANPAAKQAFINSAAAWEAKIMSPVTITMDVDYGTTRFGTTYGANVLGSTSSYVLSTGVTMRRFADSLATKNPGYADLYAAIPQPLLNNGTNPNPTPAASLANLQAIGFYPAVTNNAFGNTPAIGFNSNFTFDLDPSNGITAGQTDFDAVAVHEMGHALGFVSRVGGTTYAYTWDIFRFRPGAVKDNLTFLEAERILTPGPNPTGGDHVFWDGSREWELSTATGAREGGDGQQASHWRDDALRASVPSDTRWIGIMDPTIAAGTRLTMSLADLKALSIMGWVLTPIPTADAPLGFTTKSDHTTPNKITLSWQNPRRFFDGRVLTPFKLVLYRDNVLIKTFDSSKVNEAMQFDDINLTQYQSYSYSIAAIPYAGSDTGVYAKKSFHAGGNPAPALGTNPSIASNGSTVVVKTTSPNIHADGTILHNLSKVYLYRNTQSIANKADSIVLATTDTAKTIVFVDTPPPKFNSANSYFVSYVGAAANPAEGLPNMFASIRSGVIQSTSYSESFDVSRRSVVATSLWDSTNVSAHSGAFSFGALNYPDNTNASAYIPQVKTGATPSLEFWTVCRTEAGKDFGKVEISKNRGKSWMEILSLDESSHAEWAAGNNVWFKKSINLSGNATDTVLVRFRLTSDGANSKFGWLIDDIALNTVATGVDADRNSVPQEYSLSQNYPNPFNPSTRISYGIKDQGMVTLKVYDMLGKELRTLVNSVHDAGYYAVDLNGADLSSGVYFYQLRSGSFTAVKKFILMK